MARVAALLPTIVSALSIDGSSGARPRAETEYGSVEGSTRRFLPFTGHRDVDVFWGIPYAAPPTGERRFRPPGPFREPWAPETRDASSLADVLKKICVQLDIQGNLHVGQEDCLYLHVYRPHGATNRSSLPVLVWFYGGGFVVGDGYEVGLYDGSEVVARHEHVVVTLNYRLNALGFLALPELAEEDPEGTTGNYGVQDQRAALQWVQRNIRNFGGDPGQVTIA